MSRVVTRTLAFVSPRAVRKGIAIHGILEVWISPGGKCLIYWKSPIFPRKGDGSVSIPCMNAFQDLRLPFAGAVRTFFFCRSMHPWIQLRNPDPNLNLSESDTINHCLAVFPLPPTHCRQCVNPFFRMRVSSTASNSMFQHSNMNSRAVFLCRWCWFSVAIDVVRAVVTAYPPRIRLGSWFVLVFLVLLSWVEFSRHYGWSWNTLWMKLKHTMIEVESH